MNSLSRFIRLLTLNHNVSPTATRTISISPNLHLKKVLEEQNGNETIIRAEFVESPREKYLVKADHPHACPLCSTGLDVKHTDVLILSQFVRSDGCMLPRRITGLCRTQQKKMSALVAMSQKAGLMPNLVPSYSKKDPKKRFAWKKYNKYFDETTIKVR